ncbi:MAG TPA: hypothetical protein VJI52_04885 [Candidatus Nanoarchaeia archaeon]|nr:hypothetical protein [Candidatus Nanoarchaeia archaeon]
MFENFFKKKKKSVGHGTHWDTAALEENPQRPLLEKLIMGSIKEGALVAELPINISVGKFKLAVRERTFGELIVTTIALGGTVFTGYPSIHSGSVSKAKIKEVNIWDNDIEAQVSANFSDASFTFFPIDYAANKNKYKSGNYLDICLTGMAYMLAVGNVAGSGLPGGMKFSEDFVGIFPAPALYPGKGFENDDYEAHGTVEEVNKVDFAGEKAFILKTRVIDDGNFKLAIDIGALAKNIHGDTPKKGDKITVKFWLCGKIV